MKTGQGEGAAYVSHDARLAQRDALEERLDWLAFVVASGLEERPPRVASGELREPVPLA